MLRLRILPIFILLASHSQSQDWFPIGASWYYNQVEFLIGNSYQHFEVIGEMDIQGKNCRIVIGACQCSEYGGENYLHQEGDQIYSYDYGTDQFTLLYDFSLVPGDTMSYHTSVTGDTHYLLDSITLWNLGSETLRVQHFSHLDGWADVGLIVYERIGSAGCLYPQIGFCDPETGPLRCYEDSIIGLQNFQTPPLPCDYVTGVHEAKTEENIKIYPNPARDNLRIASDNTIREIQFINIATGTVFKQDGFYQKSLDLDLHSFIAGAYILKVFTSSGGIKNLKVIVLE